ncbi:MAG TPA: transposase [Methylomirabilota bacterium]|nr:transposase [Methylomirabilota bacterium]
MRRGLDPETGESAPPDPLAEESASLAGISGASVLGRIALGPRAGGRVRRLGQDPSSGVTVARGPRQAQLDGFDLHANVWVPGRDRARLERLCRYLLRPPLAQERLRRRADGRILVELRKTWRDGTTHLLLEPLELLEKLAALTPRPEAHLLLYHGVLAPHAAWRQRVVGFARPPEDGAGADAPSGQPTTVGRPRYQAWAVLMQRAFGLDVLACPRCGGRLRLLATIADPTVVEQILTHLGLAPAPRPPGPAPPAASAVIAHP